MSRAPNDEPNRAQVDLKQEGEIRGLAEPWAEEEMRYGCMEKSSAPPPVVEKTEANGIPCSADIFRATK